MSLGCVNPASLLPLATGRGVISRNLANQRSPNFHQVEIEERGVKLRLTVVDTPGFGDTIDNANSHQEIIRYIDQQVGKS